MKDQGFREFDRLIHLDPRKQVRATLVGRFFAGNPIRVRENVFWRGYGHLGCCSLLAIQQVLSVEPQDRTDPDYQAPKIPAADSIAAQREADSVQAEWSFTDPPQVAALGTRQSLEVRFDKCVPPASSRSRNRKRVAACCGMAC